MGASRRFMLLLLLTAAALSFFFLTSLRAPDGSGRPATIVPTQKEPLAGHAIAPKLGNATAKYVLERSRPITHQGSA
jgi:hypothetical protein